MIARVGAVAQEGRLPVVVLDLDSTLIDTGPRHHRIVGDFVAERGDAALQDRLTDLVPEDFGFVVEGPLLARGIDDPAMIDALRAYWWERFFTNEYCACDRAYPGAVAFAQRIVGAGGLTYYLTARPADMIEGTMKVLVASGFPCLRGRAVLHMKPSRSLDDHRFKRGALAEVRSLGGEVVASFENEPAHARALLDAFPEATHFLVGSTRSLNAPDPHPSLVLLPSFLD